MTSKFCQFFLGFRYLEVIGSMDTCIVKCREDGSSHAAFFDQMADAERSHLFIERRRMFRNIKLNTTSFHIRSNCLNPVCSGDIDGVD